MTTQKSDDLYTCPVCNSQFPTHVDGKETVFCPFCGADCSGKVVTDSVLAESKEEKEEINTEIKEVVTETKKVIAEIKEENTDISEINTEIKEEKIDDTKEETKEENAEAKAETEEIKEETREENQESNMETKEKNTEENIESKEEIKEEIKEENVELKKEINEEINEEKDSGETDESNTNPDSNPNSFVIIEKKPSALYVDSKYTCPVCKNQFFIPVIGNGKTFCPFCGTEIALENFNESTMKIESNSRIEPNPNETKNENNTSILNINLKKENPVPVDESQPLYALAAGTTPGFNEIEKMNNEMTKETQDANKEENAEPVIETEKPQAQIIEKRPYDVIFGTVLFIVGMILILVYTIFTSNGIIDRNAELPHVQTEKTVESVESSNIQ